jgi:hypothetical protein
MKILKDHRTIANRRWSKKYYKKHKSKILRRISEYDRKIRETLKLEVLWHYCKGKIRCQCKGCPIRHPSLLTLDHIKPIRKRSPVFGEEFYRSIIKKKFPSGFQILCGSCNSAKRANHHCPRYGKKH